MGEETNRELDRRDVLASAGGVVVFGPIVVSSAKAQTGSTTENSSQDSVTTQNSLAIERVPDPTAGHIDNDPQQRIRVRVSGVPNSVSSASRFNASVGGDPADVQSVSPPTFVDDRDSHSLVIRPPDKSSSGDYNLTVEFGGESDTEEDRIRYSGGDENETQVSTSLVMDVSGSMSGVMDKLRNAGEAFIERSTNDDYVSVVSYSSSAQVKQPIVQISSGKQDLLNSVKGLSSGGSTNIGDGLKKGFSEVDSSNLQGTRRIAIMMTDGNSNTGPSKNKIINDIVEDYNKAGYCVYAVAFRDQADVDFIRRVTQASGCGTGLNLSGTKDDQIVNLTRLKEAFRDIQQTEARGDETVHSNTKNASAGDTVQGDYQVDGSMDRVTYSATVNGANPGIQSAGNLSVASDSEVASLFDPDGNEVQSTDPGVEFRVLGDTIIYRIENPDTGEWTYTAENTTQTETEVDVKATARTTRYMSLSTAVEYDIGSEVNLTATLLDENGPARNANVSAVVTKPDDSQTTVQMNEVNPGVYNGSPDLSDLDQTGPYTATVTATDGDVELVETSTWEVIAPTGVVSDFQLEEVELVSAVVGGTLAIQVKVTNEGPQQDTQILTLRDYRGEAVDAEAVTLGSGETEENVVLAWEIEEEDVGVRDIEVRTEDDELQKTVTIGDVDSNISVSVTGTNSPVTEGEDLTVEIDIENTGAVRFDDDVILRDFDGLSVDTQSVDLNSGENASVTLTWATEDGDAGTDDVVVEAGGESSSTEVTIEREDGGSHPSGAPQELVDAIDEDGTGISPVEMSQAVGEFLQDGTVEGYGQVSPTNMSKLVGWFLSQ